MGESLDRLIRNLGILIIKKSVNRLDHAMSPKYFETLPGKILLLVGRHRFKSEQLNHPSWHLHVQS